MRPPPHGAPGEGLGLSSRGSPAQAGRHLMRLRPACPDWLWRGQWRPTSSHGARASPLPPRQLRGQVLDAVDGEAPAAGPEPRLASGEGAAQGTRRAAREAGVLCLAAAVTKTTTRRLKQARAPSSRL